MHGSKKSTSGPKTSMSTIKRIAGGNVNPGGKKK